MGFLFWKDISLFQNLDIKEKKNFSKHFTSFSGSTSSAWTGCTEEHVSAEGEDGNSEMQDKKGPWSVFQLPSFARRKHNGIDIDSLSVFLVLLYVIFRYTLFFHLR